MENRIGFGKRLLALIIDVVICSIVAFVLGPTIGGMVGATAGSVAAGMGPGNVAAGGGADAAAIGGAIGAIMGTVAAMIIVATVYFLIEGFTGWTPGKLMLGIQVANADGSKASTGTLLARYVMKNINSLLGLLAIITGVAALRTIGGLLGFVIFVGCFFVLGTARQAFHDMIAKTAVYPRSMVRAAGGAAMA